MGYPCSICGSDTGITRKRTKYLCDRCYANEQGTDSDLLQGCLFVLVVIAMIVGDIILMTKTTNRILITLAIVVTIALSVFLVRYTSFERHYERKYGKDIKE